MKILFTADWHIGVSQYSKTDPNGAESRLQDTMDVLDEIVEIAIDEGVDRLVVGGDVFHTNNPTPRQQKIFLRFLFQVEQAKIPTDIIGGNHDWNSKSSSGNALLPFVSICEDILQYSEISLSTRSCMVRSKDHTSEAFCIFYPYHGEPFDFENFKRPDCPVILVCHSHLEGAVVGAEPFEIASDSATRFTHLPVDYVLAGHFHKPQVLSEKPMAFYPGSIQCVDFNERLDEKGVTIIDTVTGVRTRVPLKRARKFKQIELRNRVTLTADDMKGVKGAVVKVIVTIPEADLQKFDQEKVIKTLQSLGAHTIVGISFEIIRPKLVRDVTISLDSQITSNFDRFTQTLDCGDLREQVDIKGREVIKRCE